MLNCDCSVRPVRQRLVQKHDPMVKDMLARSAYNGAVIEPCYVAIEGELNSVAIGVDRLVVGM